MLPFFWGIVQMGKSQIINRIHHAAQNYKRHFIGNTYMFVFDNKCFEVQFKKSSFLHLTGVGTKLSADDFYKHALSPKGLKPNEIVFDSNHPYDLADKKTAILDQLHRITSTDILIAENILTSTFTYKLGLTDLEFVVCLGNNTDKQGNVISNYFIPYSFRVEEIKNNKFSDLYEVTHIMKKQTGMKKYNTLTFGDVNTIKDFPNDILNKIETNIL